ncbi:MAG: NAD(P)-binding domain-containing protein [Ignavibacteria bacterium]|nr:NAD(P)-binding domain-containing protein [Ignavibacteria bacterium]
MKIGILGTGMVGAALGSKLASLGHSVMMGSRTPGNAKALEWTDKTGSNASAGTFSDAAFYGEIIFLCVNGAAALEAVKIAGKENLRNKTVVDVTNPLDFSKGMPPTLIPDLTNTNSLGEEIQKALPESKIVKSLNTVNCAVMTEPSRLSEETEIYLCGNDTESKNKVREILESFGWKRITDLGGIAASRGTEMMMPFWLSLWGSLKTGIFNLKIVKEKSI